MAEFKKLSAVETVESVSDAATVLIEEDGVIKRAPKDEVNVQANWVETDSSSPAFIKNKPSKELIYEWNFSADDEVYEVFENVDEDLSWLTKYQDDIGFEISVEFYGYDYRWTQEEGDHDYVFYENIYATVNSTELPHYTRYVNIPFWHDASFIIKDCLRGWIEGLNFETDSEATGKTLRILPYGGFEVYNHMHFDEEAGLPVAVENGGFVGFFSDDDSPLKSVKIYKVTR